MFIKVCTGYIMVAIDFSQQKFALSIVLGVGWQDR
jgi:hypothetical protein